MTMQKQWRSELRQLKARRRWAASVFAKTTKRLFTEMTRAERGFDKQTKRLDRRIAILAGKVS